MESLLVFGLMLVLAVLLPFLAEIRPLSGYEEIPNTIWTYEPFSLRPSQENARRRETWATFHPTYRIVVLNEKNYHHYLQVPDDLLRLPASLPEVVCLYALKEHGGLWMDSSVEVNAPFIHRLFPKKAQGAVFCLPPPTASPSPASSSPPFLLPTVIACQRDTPWIREWLRAYEDILRFPSRQAYVAEVKKYVPFPERIELLESVLSVAAGLAFHRQAVQEAGIRRQAQKKPLEQWNLFSDISSFPLVLTP